MYWPSKHPTYMYVVPKTEIELGISPGTLVVVGVVRLFAEPGLDVSTG